MTVGSGAGRGAGPGARRGSGEQAEGAGRREGGGVLASLWCLSLYRGFSCLRGLGRSSGVQRGKSAVS